MSGIAGNVSQDLDDTRPIVVATDFSSDSAAALLWASRYAALLKAPLLVLHVVHDPAESAGFYLRDKKDAERTMSDVAEEMMAAFLAEARGENPDMTPIAEARSELVTGLPPSRIIEVAKGVDAQIIIVGSRGRSGVSNILMGSVAERVAQLAPVPVVIVKGQVGG
ncbi:MAG: universal stress protein [Paracoccaceae bacterium]|nr:universal stress protein [Paracoccaceae bacterium]